MTPLETLAEAAGTETIPNQVAFEISKGELTLVAQTLVMGDKDHISLDFSDLSLSLAVKLCELFRDYRKRGQQ